ncbi:YkgJ family cysteine cluster protein [Gaoshiqia sediminis]|uniref:YkgJ family cysteine cluster protein n=1 Tax=Gaoshiqia sediminis TaxID=2986998 RepID=UPI0024A6D1AE|nr:YkgJ family cysteine cluster protein [Gaoshiqia sediminis]
MQKVLNDVVLHTEKFSKSGGLSCPSGCHLCCLKKDISATPLEFLPLAYHLFRNGQAEAFYDRLEQLPNDNLCSLFSALGQTNGGCSQYRFRGLICRLFGYSANLDKQSQTRLVTCKTIKESESYRQLKPAQLTKAPKATDYYMRLAAIDFSLANEHRQINEAIRRALEIVMTYYQYRARRRRA